MRRGGSGVVAAGLVLAGVVALAVPDTAAASSDPPASQSAQRYIVVVDDGIDSSAVADDHSRRYAARVSNVYRHAIDGYTAAMSPASAARVAADPRVAYVERDGRVFATAQTMPTGVDRIDVDASSVVSINGVDDAVNVDIAILDTGIDRGHADLRVSGGWNCAKGGPGNKTCDIEGYDDGHGHGTHVAGTAAALDNGDGVVGVAPGARLWAVRVLDNNGSGWWSWVIAGIDKVAENAGTIEVANMSLGGTGYSQAMHDALKNATGKGVYFAVAAGNNGKNVYGADNTFGTSDDYVPAAYPEVATISALADSDGAPGGTGPTTSYGKDDSFASFSNFSTGVVASNPVSSPGAAIDLLMPGVSIRSTYKGGGYATMSGTSMASPHGAGLAALHIATHGRATTAAGVATIRQALIDGGKDQASGVRLDWPATEPDTKPERLGWSGSSTPPEPSSVDAVDDAYATDEDTALVLAAPGVLANDTDSDGAGASSASLVTGPSKGAVALSADGSFTYTPTANVNGTDTFTYRAAESDGPDTDVATVTITIHPVNDAPVAVNDSPTTSVGTAVAVAVLANDVDVDVDALVVGTFSAASANGGGVTLNADNTLTYTPPPGFTGTDTLTYQAHDGLLNSNTATVTVTVSESATSASVSSIQYSTTGGKSGALHLQVLVMVVDNLGNPASGASVSIRIDNTTGVYGTATGTTGSDGTVLFKANNAPSDCYATTVTNLAASGLTWDGATPLNGPYCK